jgi:hypothetical protein
MLAVRVANRAKICKISFMSKINTSASKKITPYQLLGWTPLFITMVGATVVVALSVLRDL